MTHLTEQEPTSIEVEISTDCSCESYNEETDTSTPSPECFGCYNDAIKELDDSIVYPFLEANAGTFVIVGRNVGWQHLGGYVALETRDVDGIMEQLRINGEYRIKFIYNLVLNTLEAFRYSHDEPTGAYFQILPLEGSN
jgi:hypothetical protein